MLKKLDRLMCMVCWHTVLPNTTISVSRGSVAEVRSPLSGHAHWTSYKVSALGFRVGYTPARNNKRTNKCSTISNYYHLL